MRASGQEVPLPTFQAMADLDPLNRRVVEQMLVRVAPAPCAQPGAGAAPLRSRGTSKSAVSRRLVAKTAGQLTAWQTASLESLDLVDLLIDGVHIGEHCLIVALGIAADGQEHARGATRSSAAPMRSLEPPLNFNSPRKNVVAEHRDTLTVDNLPVGRLGKRERAGDLASRHNRGLLKRALEAN